MVEATWILRMSPGPRNALGQQPWIVTAEGFATASEAEEAGLRVASALLWNAISNRYAARLEYSSPLPCQVFDRTVSRGLHLSGSLQLTVITKHSTFVEELDTIVAGRGAVDQRLLLSMELFTSSQLEATERARFVTLVSSIEPLAEDVPVGPEVQGAVDALLASVRTMQLEDRARASLEGRLRGLGRESIARSIERLVAGAIPDDPDAVDIVREAYGLRSRLLHSGRVDADYAQRLGVVEAIYREVFAAKMGLPLARPSGRRQASA